VVYSKEGPLHLPQSCFPKILEFCRDVTSSSATGVLFTAFGKRRGNELVPGQVPKITSSHRRQKADKVAKQPFNPLNPFN